MPEEEKTEATPATNVSTLERIGSIVSQLAIAIAQSQPPPDAQPDQLALRADYQSTLEVIKLLSDIRFRCLVFVTAITAVANALLPGTGVPGTRIALGFVGFFTTLGITVYELRNSQFYEAAIHRAKALETRLGAIQTSHKGEHGGLFNERPLYVEQEYGNGLSEEAWNHPKGQNVASMRFLFVQVKHDRGLALISGAVLGGWVYLIADGILSLPAPADVWMPLPASLIGIAAAFLSFLTFLLSRDRFVYHDKNRFRPDERLPYDQNKSDCAAAPAKGNEKPASGVLQDKVSATAGDKA